MRLLCRHYNDIQLVLGGVSVMALTCLVLAVLPQAGAAGLRVFLGAVFMMYSIGYPIGHTAVRLFVVLSMSGLSLSLSVLQRIRSLGFTVSPCLSRHFAAFVAGSVYRLQRSSVFSP